MSEGLDRADSFTPGHGHVDLFATADQRFVGGEIDYAHRLTPVLSAFAQVWAGAERDALDRWQAGYGALAGLRWQW